MPWVIERKWGKRKDLVFVGKGIYTQFIWSQCGPIGRLRTPERVGVRVSAVRSVLAALASRCGKDDLCCWPSIRLIAKDTGYSTNTVMEALAAAETQGWIDIRPLASHRTTRRIGGERPHEYHLLLPNFDLKQARQTFRGYTGHYWETRANTITPLRVSLS